MESRKLKCDFCYPEVLMLEGEACHTKQMMICFLCQVLKLLWEKKELPLEEKPWESIKEEEMEV